MAVLVLEPGRLGVDRLDAMVRAAGFVQVADWLDGHVVRKHPD